MKHDIILFDLDGTLTDPALGICSCVQYALEKYGITPGPLTEYQSWIGPPLAWSFETKAGIPHEDAMKLVGYYRERFSEIGLFENEVYPGIPEMLQALKDQGARMAVATGKPTVFSERILDKFGLAPYFECVSGSSLSDHSPSKHNIMLHALEQMGVADFSRCIMVGDRLHDAEGAASVGTAFVGVLYGYGSREELENAGANNIVSSVEQLKSFLLA